MQKLHARLHVAALHPCADAEASTATICLPPIPTPQIYDQLAVVRFVKHGPRFLVYCFVKLMSWLLFNRVVLWFGGGVPGKQYELIKRDGIPIENYIARTFDGGSTGGGLEGCGRGRRGVAAPQLNTGTQSIAPLG